MEISKNLNGTSLEISLSGRLDTTTSPMLDEELKASLGEITELVLNLKNLEYVSSAGLRVFLLAQKTMNQKGKMTVKNVSSDIMDVFEITGFSDILNIE